MNNYKIKILFLLFLILFDFCCATLSKSDRKSTRKEKKSDKTVKQDAAYVSTRSISDNAMNYRDIIKEHKSFSVTQAMIRHFDIEVLGYVTPWNSHGYDIAKLFAPKFTMISPVWLQLKPKDNKGGIVIEGLHDIDRNWLTSVKELNKNIKIVPRLIFEQWTSYPALKKLLTDKKDVDSVSSELINLAKANSFDGYVVEIWSLFGGQMKQELTNFLRKLASALRMHSLTFILVIPPPSYSGGQIGMFVQQDFDNLVDHVTAFSLMSYDYSSRQRPGPNSPLLWILRCIKDLLPDPSSPNRRKILLGLNFYGYVYSKSSGNPIIGPQYISILEKQKPELIYNNATGEHSFAYWSDGAEHHVFYPTLHSINLRLQIAKEFDLGVAIWDIGQGLDYFYDLL